MFKTYTACFSVHNTSIHGLFQTAEQLKAIKDHHEEQKKEHMDQIALEQEKINKSLVRIYI